MRVTEGMKKVVVAIIALSIAALSFWAGGRYEKEPGADTAQNEPVFAGVVEDSALPPSPGAVEISPARQQLIGVKVAAVENKPSTYTLRLYGRVVPDETRTYRVNSSTDCWIRQLSDVTTGSIVQKDQILAEALAPALLQRPGDLPDRPRRSRPHQAAAGPPGLRRQQTDLANNQIRVSVPALPEPRD